MQCRGACRQHRRRDRVLKRTVGPNPN
jgi:hypothetical protein